ncbi:MAG: succinate dehydrogenase, cytochrome b556 subunit [Methylococcales bacterium]
MSNKSNSNRPTSPHLQVYRLPLTGIISISHRMTGVMLSAGLILIVYMLSASTSESGYQSMQAFMNHGLVRLIFWGFIYALFFHLCHGVRHLFWDAGLGFAKETLDRFALYELLASFTLTLIVFLTF